MPAETGKLRLILTIMIAIFQCTHIHSEDPVTKLEVVEQFIVKSAESSIYQGKEKVGTALLGGLVEATHQRGPWRYSKSLNGWVHTKDLVLVENAIQEFTKEIENNPTPNGFHLRGISYMALQNWGAAVNDLEEAYSLGESSLTLHLNLGTSLQNVGLHEKAKAEFSAIIESFPEDTGGYLARGHLLLDLEEYDAALVDLRKAVELSPSSAEIYNSIGITLSSQNQFDAAIVAYTQCIELDPKFILAFVNRGYANKNLRKYELTLQDYEAALNLEPESATTQNDLAWLLATCENESILNGPRALELALAACRTTGYREPEYLDTLAAAFAREGNFEKAEESIRTAIEMFAEGPEKESSLERLELYQAGKAFVEIIKQPVMPAEKVPHQPELKLDAEKTETEQ